MALSKATSIETNSALISEIQQMAIDIKSEDNDKIKLNYPTASTSDDITKKLDPITSESVTEPLSKVNFVFEIAPSSETQSDVTSMFKSDLTPSKPTSELIPGSADKSESISLIDFESEVTEVVSEGTSEPASQATSNNSEAIRDLMSEPIPMLFTELAAKLFETVYSRKGSDKYSFDEKLQSSPTASKRPTETATYYLDCFDNRERRFKPKNALTTSSFVFSSIDKEIFYQERNILDLGSNLAKNPMWEFQYAALENRISTFFGSGSQTPRVGQAKASSSIIKSGGM